MDTTQEKDLRDCPFCAEPIRQEAIKCKHCGEMLGIRPDWRDERPEPKMSMPAGLIVILVLHSISLLLAPFLLTNPDIWSFPGEQALYTILIVPIFMVILGSLARQKWAWFGFVALQVILILTGAIGVIFDPTNLVGIAIAILVLSYLMSPKAMRWYRKIPQQ